MDVAEDVYSPIAIEPQCLMTDLWLYVEQLTLLGVAHARA